MPSVFIGAAEQIAEQMEEHRAVYGFSYYVVSVGSSSGSRAWSGGWTGADRGLQPPGIAARSFAVSSASTVPVTGSIATP